MYQYTSRMPVSQIASDIGELRKTLGAVKKAENSQIEGNTDDNIAKFCK